MTAPAFGRLTTIFALLAGSFLPAIPVPSPSLSLHAQGTNSPAKDPIKLIPLATDQNDVDGWSDTEPSIAINPKHPQEIAVVTFSRPWDPRKESVMATVWKSKNGGQSWQPLPMIPRPEAGRHGPLDQKIAYDRDGRLFGVILASGLDRGQPKPPRAFLYGPSTSFDGPLKVQGGFDDADQPHLDILHSENQHVLISPWLFNLPPWRAGGLPMRSYATRSANQGQAMASSKLDEGPNRTTRIAVAPNGKVYLLFKRHAPTTTGRFHEANYFVVRSDDGGQTWRALGADPVRIHEAKARTTFFTTEFGNTKKGKVATAKSSDAWMACHPVSGDVCAAYVHKDESDFAQIYVARSTDAGKTWAAKRVTDGKHHSAYPEIAITRNGTVGVLYVDYDDAGPCTIFRHRFATSTDAGVTWQHRLLQEMDPAAIKNADDRILWGDYEGLTAYDDHFYGVFTGVSIGRREPQLDPIFFKIKG